MAGSWERPLCTPGRASTCRVSPCPLCVSMGPVIPKCWGVFGQWFQTTAQKPMGVCESVSQLPPTPRVSESVGLPWGSRTCVSESPRAARAGPGPHTGGWARPWGDAIAGAWCPCLCGVSSKTEGRQLLPPCSPLLTLALRMRLL